MNTILSGIVPTGPLSLEVIALNFLLTFVTALIIGWVYKKTHRGLSYSQTFVFTIILTSMVVAMVMMVIGSNVAHAFGILGAVALVRFRTPLKDTKDTGYLFLALASGMAYGTNNYLAGIVGVVMVLLAMIILERMRFGSIRTHQYVLTFWLRQDAANAGNAYEAVFRNYLKDSLLLNIASLEAGKTQEVTYHVSLIDQKQHQKFVSDISAVPGVERVQLITSRDDVEY